MAAAFRLRHYFSAMPHYFHAMFSLILRCRALMPPLLIRRRFADIIFLFDDTDIFDISLATPLRRCHFAFFFEARERRRRAHARKSAVIFF
jgi:hypothetical protein